jgi:nucleotide-binding universal stress UspA family protein
VVATDEITARAEAYAHTCVTDIDVTTEVLLGEPASRLADESTRAAVVVVGDRGLRGFRSLLAGSLPVRATAHAHCPLVVVRPHVAPTTDDLDPHHGVGRVVVGVDGSDLSRAALTFAFEEAALRGVGLTAVHSWRFPVAAGTGDMLFAIYERVDLADDNQQFLTEALAPWRERYPEVPVRPVSVQAVSPTAALIHESGGAELLVVGSSGRGGLAALLLGSVSHAAIHHAYCPVAVIHR